MCRNDMERGDDGWDRLIAWSWDHRSLGSERFERLLRAEPAPSLDGRIVLRTCLRYEIYAMLPGAPDRSEARRSAAEDPSATRADSGPAARLGARPLRTPASPRVLLGLDAARHLLRVSCGLESLVAGDRGVRSQVRRAYEESRGAGTPGPWLHRLFQTALRVGSSARHASTDRSPTLATLAVENARAAHALGRGAVVVGTGAMGRELVAHLAATGIAPLYVSGTMEDAVLALAARHGAVPVRWEAVADHLTEVGVAFGASGSGRTITIPDPMGDARPKRTAAIRTRFAQEPLDGRERAGSLLVIDLAVPRNFITEVPGLAHRPAPEAAVAAIATRPNRARPTVLTLADLAVPEFPGLDSARCGEVERGLDELRAFAERRAAHRRKLERRA